MELVGVHFGQAHAVYQCFVFFNQPGDTSFDVSLLLDFTVTYAYTLSGQVGSVVAWWFLLPVIKVTTHPSIEFSP